MINRTYNAAATIVLGLSLVGTASAASLTAGGRLSPQDLVGIGTQPTAAAAAHFGGGGDVGQDFRALGGRLSEQDVAGIASTGSARFAAHFSSSDMAVPDRTLGGRLTEYDLGERGVTTRLARAGVGVHDQVSRRVADHRLLGGRLSPADLVIGASSDSAGVAAHWHGQQGTDATSARILGGRITVHDLRGPVAKPAGA
ncbi:hypothetical protein [Arhodomonas aquaeolei]|uniref:hypothetical protein n=1 Tax=Arhodomonas aquaeolei TaxID=2369 RepID=UPI000370B1C0|nr:hypothetical protein [Arhodomonas aquaeolei]